MEIKNVLSFEKRPMFYNGIFSCHGNICYVSWTNVLFCNVHIIGKMNVCTNFEINRYTIDEFRKHAKIVGFIYVT